MKKRFRGLIAICMAIVLMLCMPCVGNAIEPSGYVMVDEMQLSLGDSIPFDYDGYGNFPVDQSINTSIVQWTSGIALSVPQEWHVWGADSAPSGEIVLVADLGILSGNAMGSALESMVQGNSSMYILLTKVPVRVASSASALPSYEVKFLDYDGNVFTTKMVQQNATLLNRMPEKHPTVKEFTFTTWYTDATLTQVFDPTTSITQDMVLYSGWELYEPPVFTAPENGLIMSDSGEHSTGIHDEQIVITIGADTMLVYGREVQLDAPAYMQDGVPMLPVRAILEQIGMKGTTLFAWDETDVDALRLYTAMGEYRLEANSNIASGANTKLMLNAAVQKENGRFFMPYDALGRLYNISAKYKDFADEDTVVLTIETKGYAKY